MNPYKKFFLFCSGVDMALLEKYPEDQNKMAGIGATVLFTGVLAFITSTYALWTVFDAAWLAIPFGLLWGSIIFNLDRYIVMSMHSHGNKVQQMLIALPRLVLASLIAVVISNPLELKIFEKEIENQLVIDQERIRQEQHATLALPFEIYIHKRDSMISHRENELQTLEKRKDELHQLALKEADGTGGSGKPNLGPIYKAKKEEADKAEEEWRIKVQEQAPLLAILQHQRDSVESEMRMALDALVIPPYNGYAARLQALKTLTRNNPIMAWANGFILLLFIVLESAPVLVKWLSPETAYDLAVKARLEERDHLHRMQRLQRDQQWSSEREFSYEAARHRTTLAIQTEKALLEKKFKRKLDSEMDDAAWNSQILS